jgi:hypothetical protein
MPGMLGALLALLAGCEQRAELASYELRPPAIASPAPGERAARTGAAESAAVTLSVVVPPGTTRERLRAIRDELKARHPRTRLLRLGFFDDRTAADHPQGPDVPPPEPDWWQHYVAQYNLNRNTGYEWFGRLHSDRAERWE